MNLPHQNLGPNQQPQKLRTWPLLVIALIGCAAVISLIILVPQYLKAPLTQLQTSLLDSSLWETPQSSQVITLPPPSVSPRSGDAPLYQVTRVVDGDTIVVNIAGQEEKIRLIGVNTPETVDPRRPVQCFGKEASNYAKTTLTGQNVSLEADPTQGDTDKYNRLLRYIFLPDGTNFNLKLIQDGYAYEYTYKLPYKYQSQFKAAQKTAESSQKGLWAPAVCQ